MANESPFGQPEEIIDHVYDLLIQSAEENTGFLFCGLNRIERTLRRFILFLLHRFFREGGDEVVTAVVYYLSRHHRSGLSKNITAHHRGILFLSRWCAQGGNVNELFGTGTRRA